MFRPWILVLIAAAAIAAVIGQEEDFETEHDYLVHAEHELQALNVKMQAWLDSSPSNSLFDAPTEILALNKELLAGADGGRLLTFHD